MSAVAPRRKGAKESAATWSVLDRVGLAACWVAGIGLCVVCLAIIGFMFVKGIQYVRPDLLFSRTIASSNEAGSGGYFDPLVGTLLLIVIGIAIALPLGIGIAVWLTEYGRPSGLARLVESGVEVVAGTPSIVLAIFGLAVFQGKLFAFLSFTQQGGGVWGRSFFTAGIMMSLIALPLIVASTREALRSIPNHVREASYALGKTRAATIRRVLLPGARPGIATGATLAMGRIAGDTAIVILLLGGSALTTQGNVPVLNILKGGGSTLTTFVYANSPAGEGNKPDKAYAAAFVLLVIVVALNFGLDLIGGRRGRTAWTK